LVRTEALDFMIDTVKATALNIGQITPRQSTVTPVAEL